MSTWSQCARWAEIDLTRIFPGSGQIKDNRSTLSIVGLSKLSLFNQVNSLKSVDNRFNSTRFFFMYAITYWALRSSCKSEIPAETVEKPSCHDFAIYKYLKSLYAKLLKSGFLDFFDSLAIYRSNFNPKFFTDTTMPVK